MHPALLKASANLGSSLINLRSMGSYLTQEPPLFVFFFMAIFLYTTLPSSNCDTYKETNEQQATCDGAGLFKDANQLLHANIERRMTERSFGGELKKWNLNIGGIMKIG